MRQDKTRQAKTRQDKTRLDKPSQDKTRQDKTRQDKPSQAKTGQDKTSYKDKARDKATEEDKASKKTNLLVAGGGQCQGVWCGGSAKVAGGGQLLLQGNRKRLNKANNKTAQDKTRKDSTVNYHR